MNLSSLPDEIKNNLPDGYQLTPGVWLVLPEQKLLEMQIWLRAEDWYPVSLEKIIWFGDDGTGNFLGWAPALSRAILWNPEDGESPWKTGTTKELWQFIQNGYKA